MLADQSLETRKQALTNLSLTDKQYLRYSRQLLVADVGEGGMAKLRQAKVLVIGLGGLGQLAAQYLSGAGIGHIHLVDHDKIELSNLPRQLLYQESDIGDYKALTAQKKLAVAFPDVMVSADNCAVTDDNIKNLLASVDIVLDCTDNFASRLLINRACVTKAVPLVIASVANLQGQLLFVDLADMVNAGCYQCLFPKATQVNQTCTSQGVLGPSVGVMASMQSQWVLNYLLGLCDDGGNLHCFNAKTLQWSVIERSFDSECDVCGQRSEAQSPKAIEGEQNDG